MQIFVLTVVFVGVVLAIISIIIIVKLVNKTMGFIFTRPAVKKVTATQTRKVIKDTADVLNTIGNINKHINGNNSQH